jgi:hypothetical protein
LEFLFVLFNLDSISWILSLSSSISRASPVRVCIDTNIDIEKLSVDELDLKVLLNGAPVQYKFEHVNNTRAIVFLPNTVGTVVVEGKIGQTEVDGTEMMRVRAFDVMFCCSSFFDSCRVNVNWFS